LAAASPPEKSFETPIGFHLILGIRPLLSTAHPLSIFGVFTPECAKTPKFRGHAINRGGNARTGAFRRGSQDIYFDLS
jgi:hypothetical protein